MTKTLIFTGGHHNSALEVALRLQDLGWHIVWFGHRHTMLGDTANSAEYNEVTQTGIEFHDILAGKFYRTWNLIHLVRIPWGFIQTFMLLLKLRSVAGIVSFGGYIAVPTVISAWLLGIPSVTHEQTITAGWANTLIGRFCKKIAVSWPESAHYYPSDKVVITGLPIRHELLTITNNPNKLIFFFCGKQGSHAINLAVFAVLDELLKKYTIIHQVGSSTVHNDMQQAQTVQHPNYHPYAYMSVADVANFYSQATVVVGRAGAHTTYELAHLSIRCVLIPLPNSSHNEQLLQAQSLASVGQAVVLPQDQLTPASLLASITQACKLQPRKHPVIANGTDQLVELVESTFT